MAIVVAVVVAVLRKGICGGGGKLAIKEGKAKEKK